MFFSLKCVGTTYCFIAGMISLCNNIYFCIWIQIKYFTTATNYNNVIKINHGNDRKKYIGGRCSYEIIFGASILKNIKQNAMLQ